MILSPRVKHIRPNEDHLFCDGEGCDARLAVRTCHPLYDSRVSRKGNVSTTRLVPRSDGTWASRVTLETRYTKEPDPGHQAGTWWRRKTGGYKGLPAGKKVRREQRIGWEPHQSPPAMPKRSGGKLAPLPQSALDHIAKYTTIRRDTDRVDLPSGEHLVTCYRCDGLTILKVNDDHADHVHVAVPSPPDLVIRTAERPEKHRR